MGIVSWILFGLVAGIVAKLITPGRDPGGFIVTTLLGILGAFVGGWISTMMGFGRTDTFAAPSFLMAVAGAVIVLLVYRFASRRRAHP